MYCGVYAEVTRCTVSHYDVYVEVTRCTVSDYDVYAANIWKEYCHMSPEAFCKGRSKVGTILEDV